VIVDASVVAAGISGRSGGDWARSTLQQGGLAAPHLMPVEVTHSLRLDVRRGSLTTNDARVALGDLLSLPVELHPFDLVADRVWALRETVSAYDAWYVALAEALDVPLATLDARLARAPGPRCEFLVPTEGVSGQST
jgi:predicted nucleic acid-binding protein